VGEQREIFEDEFSVSEKIELIRNLITTNNRFSFSSLFQTAATRSEVVTTFLALLELIRLKQLTAVQTEAFGEIELCRAPQVEENLANRSTLGDTGGDAPPPSREGAVQ
jgi:segregation and condensation protein A